MVGGLVRHHGRGLRHHLRARRRRHATAAPHVDPLLIAVLTALGRAVAACRRP